MDTSCILLGSSMTRRSKHKGNTRSRSSLLSSSSSSSWDDPEDYEDVNSKEELELEVCQGMECDGIVNTLLVSSVDVLTAVHDDDDEVEDENDHEDSYGDVRGRNRSETTAVFAADDFIHVAGDAVHSTIVSEDEAVDGRRSLTDEEEDHNYHQRCCYTCALDEGQPYRTRVDNSHKYSSLSKLCVFDYPPLPFILEQSSNDSHLHNSEGNSFSKTSLKYSDRYGSGEVIDALLPGTRVTVVHEYTASIDKSLMNDAACPVPFGQSIDGEGVSLLNVWNTKKATFLYIKYNRVPLRNGNGSTDDYDDDKNTKWGYICYSFDSYKFLRRRQFVNDVDRESLVSLNATGKYGSELGRDDWVWRVTYIGGAYVRKGIELSSDRIALIPYGSYVRVVGRVINAMGLARLCIRSFDTKIDDTAITGFISEKLNPQSGQSGFIAKSLPFSFPRKYQVILNEGAVIREGKELSSREVNTASFGTTVTAVAMEYSEHPADRCIERLKLNFNHESESRFISLKLNRLSPNDVFICDYIGDDDLPAFTSSRRVNRRSTQTGNIDGHVIEESEELDDMRICTLAKPQDNMIDKAKHSEKKCVICLLEDRTSTIVHGETGHIACCLSCARILKARGDRCPVCRLDIDSVIQHFWA